MSLADGFAWMQIIYSLDQPMRWLPEFLGVFMEFVVSMKRIQKFLLWDEINPHLVEYHSSDAKSRGLDILIENANFSWGGQKQEIVDEKAKGTNQILRLLS